MFTIFTIPKPFTDPHINIIQRNAINSWKKLVSGENVFLVGNDAGVAEAAKELKVRHLPNVKVNEYNTPLLDSAFDLVKKESRGKYLIYANADIIFIENFFDLIKNLPNDNFLISGRRWDLDVRDLIDFDQANWRDSLKIKVQQNGSLHPPTGMDYFIFPKDQFSNIPPFAVGRVAWDTWMIKESIKQKKMTIDATNAIMIVHQNHNFMPGNESHGTRLTNPEAKMNIKLTQSTVWFYTLEDADWLLSQDGVRRKPLKWLLFNKSRWFIATMKRKIRNLIMRRAES